MVRHSRPTVTVPLDATPLVHRRQTATDIPELCGFVDRTSAIRCDTGSTCKFNTDIHAVGCCKHDDCNWQTTCCGYHPGPSTFTWDTFTSTCGGTIPALVGSW
ncbi:hypothetical protein QBC34DRAFT_57511 [Podospora aff. communis PSN243]|uniref:Uncharacterized protein n=1 Tax=Podospora aff. communis PSN243 TaxID=3040156 RepID=A0AAV9GTG5_9PEZI|nr:hypothetical protein QBC34DRAFT_57511 [Podospora aff. communis PSN243]